MKILFSSNIAWSIYSFRKSLLLDLQKQGHKIATIAKEDAYSPKLKELGFEFYPIHINNNSKNPFKDIGLVIKYINIYKKINPDIILHNAIKPNIYGTIAAGILGIPVVNNISGLGTLFIKQSISTKIAKFLYKYSQKFANIVFFQNNTDKSLFIKEKLVSKNKIRLIPGSGVDTIAFHPSLNTNQNNEIFEFLMVARLLKDKGIMEYLEAAKQLKEKYGYKIIFSLLGPFYTANETAMKPHELKEWQQKNIINYLGEFRFAPCKVRNSYFSLENGVLNPREVFS